MPSLQIQNHYLILFKGFVYVDDTLIVGATESQAIAPAGLDKRSVDKYVDVLQQLPLCRHVEKLLECKSGITPDVVAKPFNLACERKQRFCLIHWVASAESDVEVVVYDTLDKFVCVGASSGIERPCGRVVAAGTRMSAAGYINRCAQPGAVDGCAVDNIDYA